MTANRVSVNIKNLKKKLLVMVAFSANAVMDTFCDNI